VSIIASLPTTTTALANRVVCGEEDHVLWRAKNRNPQPWFFDVMCHGDESGIPVPLIAGHHVAITVEQLAIFIEAQPGYCHKPVRLLMCWLGKDYNGFAQQLADRLRVPVLAAPDLISTDLFECETNSDRFRMFWPSPIEEE
jgi:hypothetical protein